MLNKRSYYISLLGERATEDDYVGGWVSVTNRHDIRLNLGHKVWVKRIPLSKPCRELSCTRSINGCTVKIVRHRVRRRGHPSRGKNDLDGILSATVRQIILLEFFFSHPAGESPLRLIKFLITAIRFSSKYFRLSNLKFLAAS